MALNKFMHPRNRYKKEKPSFLKLALKYPEFRAHITQDDSGKVFLDFKDADALRALTTCLLKEDFDLSVELPSDRLVPTLPLRLNYILWLEDIVGKDPGKWGIDIGTGASCVYPLLAARMNQWHFLATEADPENFFHAKKNVGTNEMNDFICVKQVTSEDALLTPLEDSHALHPGQFDFCMCNPPFFADHMEAQALTSTRSPDRPESNSVSTASPQECIAAGGEVGFVRQMIEESAVLRDRVRVYTSMVGKKTSLAKLKEELRHHQVSKFSTTEFCQGKTMRWGIAWTFDSTVVFPRSPFEARKEKPPLHFTVPKGAGSVSYEVHAVASFLKELLQSIKIHVFQGKQAKSYSSLTLTAGENTWCHQRRLRRQQQRLQKQCRDDAGGGSDGTSPVKDSSRSGRQDVGRHTSGGAGVSGDRTESESEEGKLVMTSSDLGNNEHVVTSTQGKKRPLENYQVSEKTGSGKRIRRDDDTGSSHNKNYGVDGGDETSQENGSRPDAGEPDKKSSESSGRGEGDQTSCSESGEGQVPPQGGSIPEAEKDSNPADGDCGESSQGENSEVTASSSSLVDTSPKEFILKCVMRLKRADEQVQMELEWLEGDSRELMHQLFTFLKNKLTTLKVKAV
ncbi:RNA N6-adenosine-methyltransferase mettl16 [Aplysia californica]|uniref:U6 snRNA m(6)A methyltransferase n=1 Tax=Aplysia californica TaxID=6500 RepID=A0ABM0K139_APLCA|nr:RNA N6-adenosine-methyltransferase mettl16 [Aplysia californica]